MKKSIFKRIAAIILIVAMIIVTSAVAGAIGAIVALADTGAVQGNKETAVPAVVYASTGHNQALADTAETGVNGTVTGETLADGESIIWTAWNANDSLPEVAGNYYLTQNVKILETWHPAKTTQNGTGQNNTDGDAETATQNGTGQNNTDGDAETATQSGENGITRLRLDGYNITALFDGSVIEVESNSTLILMDYADEPGIITHLMGSFKGIGIKVNGGTLEMYGGNVKENTTGIVNDGTAYLYGGKITSNTQSGILNIGTLTVQGGSISNNINNSGNGGGINNQGTLNIGSGSICNNKALKGGGIYSTGSGGLIFTGGAVTITGNMAKDEESYVTSNLGVTDRIEFTEDANLYGSAIGISFYTTSGRLKPGIFSRDYSKYSMLPYFISDSDVYVVTEKGYLELETVGDVCELTSDEGTIGRYKTLAGAFEELDEQSTGFYTIKMLADYYQKETIEVTSNVTKHITFDTGGYLINSYSSSYPVFKVDMAKGSFTITANTISWKGGTIVGYAVLLKNGKLTLDGSINLDRVQLAAGQKIYVGNLTDRSSIGIYTDEAGGSIQASEPYAGGLADRFKSTDWVIRDADNGDGQYYLKLTKKVNVTFAMNGHGDDYYGSTEYDTPVARPEDPTDTGYKFAGWYTEKACVNEWDFAANVKSDMTLYAKWKKIPEGTDISLIDPSGIYDGTSKEAQFTAPTGMGQITPRYFITEGGEELESAPKDVGSYVVQVDVAEGEWYTAATKIGFWKIDITQREATVTADDASKIYGTADPTEFTATVSNLVKGDSLTYTVSRESGEEVKTYKITPTGDASQGNYTVQYVDGTFVINKAGGQTITNLDSLSYEGDYDGTSHGIAATVSITSGTTISYSVDGGAWTSSAPTIKDVGTKVVKVKAENPSYETVEGTYTLKVNQRTATVTAADASKLYGEKDPAEFPSIVKNVLSGDKIVYSVSREEGENVGSYKIIPSGQQSQGNYNVIYVGGTFAIKQAKGLEVTNLGNLSYEGTYDGENHGTAATVNITSGTTISYSVDGGEWTTTLPTIKDVGTKLINVKAENPNYETAEGSYTLKVNQRQVTVTAQGASKTYGDKDPDKFTAEVKNIINGDKITYAVGREKGEDVGTYAIIPTGETSQGNYKVEFVNAVFTINKSNGLKITNLASLSYEGIYDGKAHGEAARASVTGGTTISYSVNGGEWTTEAPSIKDVETKSVKVKAENSNYVSTEEDYTLSVSQRAVTVTADDASKIYGTADPAEFTATVSNLVKGDSLTYTVSRESGEEVRTYKITPTGDASQGNYTVQYVDGAFVINKAGGQTITNLDSLSYEGDYDGTSHGIAATVSITSGTTISYSVDGGAWTSSAPTIKDAGTKVVKVKAENSNYETVEETYTLKVNQRTATVTADDASKIYGTNDPAEFKVTFKNVLEGDKITCTVSRQKGEDVGSYRITPSGAASQGNYKVEYIDGTFAINKASGMVVTAQGYKGVYDGKSHSVTTAVSVEGATVSYSVDGGEWTTGTPSITDFGTKQVKVRAEHKNYETEESTCVMEVTRACATVTAEDATKVYGEKDPKLTATVTGLLGKDSLKYSVTRTAGEDVGEYEITAGGEAVQGNYEVTYKTARFTITKSSRNAPAGITSVAETVSGNNDGKIVGVTQDMEWRIEAGNYTAISGSELTGLAPGTYYVRLKETKNYLASADTRVIVEKGRKLEVKFDLQEIGTAPTTQKLEWGQTATEPEAPITEGHYVFVGWFTDKTYKTNFDFSKPISADTTVYGKWIAGGAEVIGEGPGISVNQENLINILYKYGAMYSQSANEINLRMTLSKEAVSQEEMAAITKATDRKNLTFIEIRLELSVDGGEYKDIGNDNDVLVTVTYAFDTANKKDVQVFRVHGGVVDQLTETPNKDGECVKFGKGEVEIVALKYSAYAFAWDDVPKGPDTGDRNNVLIWIIVAAVCVVAVAVVIIVRRKRK